MGFLDKAKEQMAVATTVAKDAAQKGQAKIDAAQAKRAAMPCCAISVPPSTHSRPDGPPTPRRLKSKD